MKKILAIAMAVAAATTIAATPAKKDKKQKTQAPAAAAPAPVQLISPSDSLSYAAGMFTTRGLMEYVQQQYGVDSTGVADFVEGLKEGIARQHDKQFVARNAGIQIAQMLETRIYPNVKGDVKGTEYTLDSLKFNEGFVAAVLGDTAVMNTEAANRYFQSTMQAAKQRAEEVYKADNEQWLKQNASKSGVKTTASGLQYRVITAGTGATAKNNDNVTVRYEGRLIDGTVFDSSYKRNPDTSTFRPDQVIKGWTEALCMMPEGSKWELYIPQNLAYGSRQAGNIKPFSTLIFTVEVVKVEPHKEEAKTDAKPAAAAKKPAAAAKKPAAKKRK